MQGSFALGWRQVGICVMLLAATSMIASTYSIVGVPLTAEFQPSRSVLALAMTILSATAAVLSPFLGSLMERAPLRWMMAAGGVSLACGYYAMSLATAFWQVLAIFAVLIAPANVLIGPVAATVLLTRWFTRIRGRAIGIAIAGISVGSFIFPIIVQGLLDAYDWREALRWFSLVLLAWTVPAALLVVNRPEERGLFPDGAAEPPEEDRDTGPKPQISALQVLSDPAFWLICLTVAVVTGGMKGMITSLAPLAIDAGITASKAATLISVYAACGFCAKLGFAMLSDRVSPRILMAISLAGFAGGMAMLTQSAGGYATIALGVGLIGLFGGLMVPLESFLAPRIFGKHVVGRAMGLISMVTLGVLLCTPPLFGLIYDLTHSYKAIFVFFSGLALAAILIVPRLRTERREGF